MAAASDKGSSYNDDEESKNRYRQFQNDEDDSQDEYNDDYSNESDYHQQQINNEKKQSQLSEIIAKGQKLQKEQI